jgi:hypothetical protein
MKPMRDGDRAADRVPRADDRSGIAPETRWARRESACTVTPRWLARTRDVLFHPFDETAEVCAMGE